MSNSTMLRYNLQAEQVESELRRLAPRLNIIVDRWSYTQHAGYFVVNACVVIDGDDYHSRCPVDMALAEDPAYVKSIARRLAASLVDLLLEAL